MAGSTVLPGPVTATRSAPHVRDARSLRSMNAVTVFALLPCVLVGAWNTGSQANRAIAASGDAHDGGWRADVLTSLGVSLKTGEPIAALAHGLLYLIPVFLIALLAAAVWEEVFARARRRRRGAGVLVVALLFTLLLPPPAPLWQVALGMSVGVVLGCHVFGGIGLGFVHPSALGAAFLHLSYPSAIAGDPLWSDLAGYGGTRIFQEVAATGMDALVLSDVSWNDAFLGHTPGLLGVTSTLACVVGAGLLLERGVIAWRTLAAVLIGLVLATWFVSESGFTSSPVRGMPWTWHLVLGSFAFGTVFLATDPMTTPTTAGGRWLHGLGVGFVVVLIRTTNPLHPDGVLFAVLLGNVFAPALDALAVWVHTRNRTRRRAQRRERRHG